MDKQAFTHLPRSSEFVEKQQSEQNPNLPILASNFLGRVFAT